MMTRTHITIVSGGIGSGKSVVCRVLECKGYHVYDCDSRAKTIMDNSLEIKQRIAAEVCADALDSDMCLRRDRIARAVFTDAGRLARLNTIVHAAVRADIQSWIGRLSTDNPRLFIETAIPYQSGLDAVADDIWEVTAPTDVRIGRVCRRNGLTPEQVADRIASQTYTPDTPHPHIYNIDNSGRVSLLRQIEDLLMTNDTSIMTNDE